MIYIIKKNKEANTLNFNSYNLLEAKCYDCKKIISICEFGKKRAAKHGVGSYCKKCSARRKIKNKYKLDLEEYDRMFVRQNNKCYICQEEKKLYVDHCHKTGRVRKLLCNRCNIQLGTLEQPKEIIEKFQEYIKEHEEPQSEKQCK